MAMNVIKNWPSGGGLEDSAIPYPGTTFEAGMFLKKVVHPTLANQYAVRAIDVGGGDDHDDTFVTLFALDSSYSYDVISANKVPYLLGNAIVSTTMTASTATFTSADIGTPVYISDTEAGRVTNTAPGGNDIIVGFFDGFAEIYDINGDTVEAVRIILAPQFSLA